MQTYSCKRADTPNSRQLPFSFCAGAKATSLAKWVQELESRIPIHNCVFGIRS